jgi:hypothetical protein
MGVGKGTEQLSVGLPRQISRFLTVLIYIHIIIIKPFTLLQKGMLTLYGSVKHCV